MQHQPLQTPSPVEKKEKKTGSVAFILSLLFHGGILLMIGGIVLIPAVVQKSAFTADPNMVVPTDIQMDEPPDAAQDQNDLPPSQAPQENMQLSEQPAPAAQNDLFVAREDTGASASSWAGLAASAPVDIKPPTMDKKENQADEQEQQQKKMSVGSRVTLFGSTDKTSNGGLEGYFYDLKQSPTKKPNEMAVKPGAAYGKEGPECSAYEVAVGKFIKAGFRASSLNNYLQVSQPMYLSSMFIPPMGADEAPKAFNVEKEVQPRRWVIHYKGKISPPDTGRYRFWGLADDMLFVAIDGNLVLNGSLRSYNVEEPGVLRGKDGKPVASPLRAGKWMKMNKGQKYTMDLAIGEEPGGSFYAFLLVEKEGDKYSLDESGVPYPLPIFKMANTNIKVTDDQMKRIPFKFRREGMVFPSE